MKPLPACQLDPRIKNVWRLNDFIWILFASLSLAALGMLLEHVAGERAAGSLVLYGAAAFFVVANIVWLVVLPPIRFIRWRYEVSADYLDIATGIIWRKRTVIPFIRVQNTDTRQGPILRLFRLSSVTVSTAAGEHEIPGLGMQVAETLRDRAAELARLAREDV